MAEYIRKIRKIAGKLRHWLDKILAHYVRDSLKRELYHMCLPRGIPDQLNDWYHLVINVELDLMEYKGYGRPETHPKRNQEKHTLGRKQSAALAAAPTEVQRRVPSLCFHYGQETHRAAMCLTLTPRAVLPAPLPPKPKNQPSKGKEKLCMAHQVIEVLPPESKGEGTPTEEEQQ